MPGKFLRVLCWLLLAFTATVRADIVDTGSERQIFLSGNAWKVSVPRQDWLIVNEKRSGTDQVYYMMASAARQMNFSVFIERSNKCQTPATCMDLVLSNPTYKDRQGQEQSELGKFKVVQFWIEAPYNGMTIKQRNVYAEAYIDGFWVDVHVSVAGRDVPDAKPLMDFISQLAIK